MEGFPTTWRSVSQNVGPAKEEAWTLMTSQKLGGLQASLLKFVCVVCVCLWGWGGIVVLREEPIINANSRLKKYLGYREFTWK